MQHVGPAQLGPRLQKVGLQVEGAPERCDGVGGAAQVQQGQAPEVVIEGIAVLGLRLGAQGFERLGRLASLDQDVRVLKGGWIGRRASSGEYERAKQDKPSHFAPRR